MKNLFSVFVLMFGLTVASFAQTQNWSKSASIEDINVDFSAVTVDDYIDAYTLTTIGSIDEGWTAVFDIFTYGPYTSNYMAGRPIKGPLDISWEDDEWVFTPGEDPINDMSYCVSLYGPEYDTWLCIGVYLDYETGEFTLY